MQKDGRIHWVLKHMMIVAGAVFAVLLGIRGMRGADLHGGGQKLYDVMKDWAGEGLEILWRQNYPAASLMGGRDDSSPGTGKEAETVSTLLCRVIFGQSPLYRYLTDRKETAKGYEEQDPAYWEYAASGKFYEEHQYLLYDGGEESGEDGTKNPGMTAGGSDVTLAGDSGGPAAENSGGFLNGSGEGAAGQGNGGVLAGTDAMGNLTVSSGEDALTCAASAVWPITGQTYRLAQLADYDYMMKHFYSVHTSTTAGRDFMNAESFLEKDFTLTTGAGQPQILIYHTHSQEEFADYSDAHPERTVVGMGDYLTKLLKQKGFYVIHDTSVYDFKDGKLDRNKAYTYALDGISRILQENPSIEVILDLHRDGVNESLHMVNEVGGKPTAPIMFFNGVSQTPEGPIEYLPNPYREDNLAFSFQMQLDAAAYFPGLTRKIYIKGLRYNLHLRPRSSLIEVGAQTNTYEEALNAMEPLAEVLTMVLQGN